MNSRSGVTLVEVLIAIFVTSIGLLALLALFPVAALSMANAVKADRSSHCARSAAGVERIWNIRNDPTTGTTSSALFFPSYTVPDPTNTGALPAPPSSGPSYPVFIDPIGADTYFGFAPPPLPVAGWVGGMNGTAPLPYGIPRRSVPFLGDVGVDANLAGAPYRRQKLLSWCALLDDLTFNEDGPNLGLPVGTGLGGALQRDLFYSWAWLCREQSAGSTTPPPQVTIVVYYRRVPQPAPGGALAGEHPFQADYQANGRIITLRWAAGAAAPNVRKGMWILDPALLNPVTGLPDPHGYFYRVVDVVENAPDSDPLLPNSISIEVQGTLKLYPTDPLPPAARRWAVIMEDVVEVFERP